MIGAQTGSTRYERDQVEFVRATAFFDATFAIAATLLVTTIALTGLDWSSWSKWWNAIENPLLAFGISFTVIAAYWKSNHDFVKQLNALTSRFISVMLVLLAFVVLLPVSTRGLGESLGSDQVTTVVYAINVAIISSTEWICYRIAVGQKLFQVPPSPTEIRTSTVLQLIAPGVFLGSIALTVLWDPTVGRVSWLSLVVIMPIAGSWARRTNAAAPVSGERHRPA